MREGALVVESMQERQVWLCTGWVDCGGGWQWLVRLAQLREEKDALQMKFVMMTQVSGRAAR